MSAPVVPISGGDAHRVLPHLWQGRRPPKGPRVARMGFDVLVLAAEEYQPPADDFPGVYVVHVPLDDHQRPFSPAEWSAIVRAANIVARNVRKNRRVLVTCNMGINRSGIITAMAVCMLLDVDGKTAVKVVRKARPGALQNRSFAAQIEGVMV